VKAPREIRRVIVVVLDGLRPDAVTLFGLGQLERLKRRGAATYGARTVTPSVTAAAMASLLTGVPPALHGLRSDRFHVPRRHARLMPLPLLLTQAGLPTSAYLAGLPRGFRGIATRIAERLGLQRVCFSGESAPSILAAAFAALEAQDTGLILIHWPDADRAGHRKGWMSVEYARAARLMDSTLGTLVARTELWADPSTVLIALADHGGGGRESRDHQSSHPRDRTIPIWLAGGSVVSGELAPVSSLLDVPATVLWSLGQPIPASYAGRPLVEAFRTATPAMVP